MILIGVMIDDYDLSYEKNVHSVFLGFFLVWFFKGFSYGFFRVLFSVFVLFFNVFLGFCNRWRFHGSMTPDELVTAGPNLKEFWHGRRVKEPLMTI